jgi:hypothetical protein
MSATAQSHHPSEYPHFQFAPDSGRIAASHRSATKSADARRGAADGGELRRVAGDAAPRRGTMSISKMISVAFAQSAQTHASLQQSDEPVYHVRGAPESHAV